MPESASPEPIEKPAGCLTTLGSVRLTLESPDREPLVIIGPGKPLALLTYLALSVGRTATRCSSLASNRAKLNSFSSLRSDRYVASTKLNHSTSSLATSSPSFS